MKFLRPTIYSFFKHDSWLMLLAGAVILIIAGSAVWLIQKELADFSPVDKNNIEKIPFIADVNLPQTYDKPLLIKLSDLAISITPLGANLAKAATEKNVVKYVNAFASTDVVQTKYANKIKEDIILKSPSHPEIFKYQIDLTSYDFKKDSEGNLIFYEKGHRGEDNYQRFTIPAPFMIDADGRKSSTAEVACDLNSAGQLTLKPSAEWLKQAKYPVILDPTIEITILNVHSHPAQGDNWTVDFTTQGAADLKIIPNDQATIDDDEFVSLSCGSEKHQPKILAGDVISFPNWSCSGTATVIHFTKKAGNHTLRFEFGGQTAYAYNATWLSGYAYRKPVTLSRSSGAVTDYQMKLLLGESSGATGEDVDCGGLCATDFDDIRFTKSDGTTVLDYWVESISGATPNQLATIWIEFDSIGTGATTFYMYYGNAGAAAASNGPDTFPFFDHFDGDASKWAGDTAALGIASSVGTLTATGAAWKKVYGNVASASDGAMRTRATLQNNIGYTMLAFADSASAYSNAVMVLSEPASTNDSKWATQKAAAETTISNTSIGGDSYHIYELRRTLAGTDTVNCFIDDVQAGANTTTNVPVTNLYASFLAYGNTNHVHVDWILIRQYLLTEPAWGAWGAQESEISCGSIATGGTITTDGLYTVHTFTTDGTFTPTKAGNVEVLVVAGGGAGGVASYHGAGGGAGGIVYNPAYSVTTGAKTVTIGAGGTTHHDNGQDSVFDALTAIGGGAGGDDGHYDGHAGGSGGGANKTGTPGDADYLSPRQGYDGGSGNTNYPNLGQGGGGGASAIGGNGTSTTGGNGGDGTDVYSNLLIAANAGVDISGVHWIAGGGGGSTYSAGTPGTGGKGGGGDGSISNGTPGTVNTGGGGGGSERNGTSDGADGGSGVVIVRYLTTSQCMAPPMTLRSNVIFRDGGTTIFRKGGTPTIDQYTKMLLHADGANGATVFTDEAFLTRDISAVGNPVIDNSYKKFGTGSIYINGNGNSRTNYLSIPGDSNFDFRNSDFTIDLWAYAYSWTDNWQAVITSNTFQGGNSWGIHFNRTSLKFTAAGVDRFSHQTAFSLGNWHHIALVKSGTSVWLFLDGVKSNSSYTTGQTDAWLADANSNPGLLIGSSGYNNDNGDWNGYIDEVRVSKGIARWTSDFAPPAAPY